MDRLEHSTIKFPILISTLISSLPKLSFHPLSSCHSLIHSISPRVEEGQQQCGTVLPPLPAAAPSFSAYELLLILQNPAVMVTISKTDSPGSWLATLQILKSSTRINRIAKMLITSLLSDWVLTQCSNVSYYLVLIKNIYWFAVT